MDVSEFIALAQAVAGHARHGWQRDYRERLNAVSGYNYTQPRISNWLTGAVDAPSHVLAITRLLAERGEIAAAARREGMTYPAFSRLSAARWLARTFDIDLESISSWEGFRAAALAARGDTEAKMQAWVEAMRERYGTASTGERAALIAGLVAVDYRWLAEELTDGGRSFLDLADYVRGGEWGAAVGMLLAGVDPAG